MTNPTYKIAKWQETFETADSRRHKSLSWVSLPVGFSSNGYHELVSQFGDEAPAIYGAWCALLSVAATAPTRGTLASSKGPYSMARIASETRMPEVVFTKLFAWASQEQVGWLIVDETTVNQSSTSRQPVVNQPVTSLPNLTQQDITKPNQETISAETAEPSSTVADEVEIPVLEFPCDGTKGMGKSWKLLPSYVAELQAAFPNLDIAGECRKALLWVNAKPSRRKTANGMKAFLSGWMGRNQNKGSPSRNGTHSSGRTLSEIGPK